MTEDRKRRGLPPFISLSMYMKHIKSIIDTITNSSDETYIVRGVGSAAYVQEKFSEYMEKTHPDEWINGGQETYRPDKYEDVPDDGVKVEWTIMCNLDDAYQYLCECFGADHIHDPWNDAHRHHG